MYIKYKNLWLNITFECLYHTKYTKQKHSRCKKGEAKSEAPKVILIIYSTKKIDVIKVEAKARITDRIV